MLPAALAVALLLPLAPLAHLDPASAQADAGCLGGAACSVPGSGLAGFVPPVVAVASGGAVTWTSLDGAHVNEEGALGGSEATCFAVTYSGNHPTFVTFRYADGVVTAAGEGDVERACTTAVAAGPVGLVAYRCIIHPLTMHGVVVVLAA